MESNQKLTPQPSIGSNQNRFESFEAMADVFSMPEVATHVSSNFGPVLKTVPASQRLNAYVHPWHLSLDENAKAGKYPSMYQIRCHFGSVVWKTYQSEREALEIKFDKAPGEEMGYFNVRYIDGHCKGIMCQAVFGLMIYMDSRLKKLCLLRHDFFLD